MLQREVVGRVTQQPLLLRCELGQPLADAGAHACGVLSKVDWVGKPALRTRDQNARGRVSRLYLAVGSRGD